MLAIWWGITGVILGKTENSLTLAEVCTLLGTLLLHRDSVVIIKICVFAADRITT